MRLPPVGSVISICTCAHQDHHYPPVKDRQGQGETITIARGVTECPVKAVKACPTPMRQVWRSRSGGSRKFDLPLNGAQFAHTKLEALDPV
jgi:hypothetical protein